MNETIDNVMAVGLLSVVALFMAMVVGLAFKMPVKHTIWFFVAMFAVLSVIAFREHWAFGVLVLIVGTGGVTALVGVRRLIERDKDVRRTEVKNSA